MVIPFIGKMKNNLCGDILFKIYHLKSNKELQSICHFTLNTSFLKPIDQPEEYGYFDLTDKTI